MPYVHVATDALHRWAAATITTTLPTPATSAIANFGKRIGATVRNISRATDHAIAPTRENVSYAHTA
jgi:hypothetical protein